MARPLEPAAETTNIICVGREPKFVDQVDLEFARCAIETFRCPNAFRCIATSTTPMLVEETPTTASALMAAPPEIELYANALRGAPSLSPITHLCIVDVTDGHTEDGVLDGRALAADGLELLLVVVSEQFVGMPLLQRQRAVNGVLADDLRSGRLHSVRMKCWTPAQWEGKFGRTPSIRASRARSRRRCCTIHRARTLRAEPLTTHDSRRRHTQ